MKCKSKQLAYRCLDNGTKNINALFLSVIVFFCHCYVAKANVNKVFDENISYTAFKALANDNRTISLHKEVVKSTFNSKHQENLLTYSSDDLTLFAMQLTPLLHKPKSGWPLVIFLHGYHPEPKRYGKMKDGSTKRPGAYYKDFPLSYANNGYMVITPDYRGHNESQGEAFTKQSFASLWYVRDVLNLFKAIDNIEEIDTRKIYVVGHSMGSGIGLIVSTLLSEKITAMSLWSTGKPVSYAKLYQSYCNNQNKLITDLAWLHYPEDIINRAEFTTPIMLQHGIKDRTTAFNNSAEIALRLSQYNKLHKLIPYNVKEHLFTGDDFNTAIKADLAWFTQHGSSLE